MNCKCKTCNGEGYVKCDDCNGQGRHMVLIQYAEIDAEMDHHEELLELQKDALRVIKQSERLIEMKPERKRSYEQQLAGTLHVINTQANELQKK